MYVQKSDFHLTHVFCVVIFIKKCTILWLVHEVFSQFVLFRSKIPLLISSKFTRVQSKEAINLECCRRVINNKRVRAFNSPGNFKTSACVVGRPTCAHKRTRRGELPLTLARKFSGQTMISGQCKLLKNPE